MVRPGMGTEGRELASGGRRRLPTRCSGRHSQPPLWTRSARRSPGSDICGPARLVEGVVPQMPRGALPDSAARCCPRGHRLLATLGRRRRCRIATYFLRRRGDARRAPPSRQLHPPRFERWQYRRNCSSPRRRHRRRRPTMPTLGRFPPSLDPMTSARSRHHCFRLFFSLQASEEERRCSTITSCSRCERDIAMALSSPPSVGGGHSLEPRRRRRCRRCSGRSGRARPPPPPLPVAWIWSTSSERSAEFVLWNV